MKRLIAESGIWMLLVFALCGLQSIVGPGLAWRLEGHLAMVMLLCAMVVAAPVIRIAAGLHRLVDVLVDIIQSVRSEPAKTPRADSIPVTVTDPVSQGDSEGTSP